MMSRVDSVMGRTTRSAMQAELAALLVRGDLVLLLGAGVSSKVGLPDWEGLANRVAARCGVGGDTSAHSAQDLLSLSQIHCRDESPEPGNSSFLAHVRDALYQDVRNADGYSDSLVVNRLLIAIGAMVMSSMRGSTTDVFTLNLDDVLDWYLHLHGFRTQVVTEMPTILHADVDARIHHLHGFLPLQDTYVASRWAVLTGDEYVRRLAESSSVGWPNLFLASLQTKRVLVVGTSFSDPDIQVLFQKTVGDSGRHCGYAMIVPSNDEEVNRLTSDRLDRAGLKRIEMLSYDDYPDFLLDVCRRAATARDGPASA